MNEETSQEEVLEKEQTTEVESEAVVTEEEKTEGNEEPKEEPKQTRSQDAKQRLRRKLGKSEQRNEQLAEENRKLSERFSALEQKVEVVVNPPPPRPGRDDFETEEGYEDALHEWRTPKVVVEQKPEPIQPRQEDILSPEVRKSWNEQMDAGADKHDDFEDIVFSIKHDSMTDTMTFAITESEHGGEVAYFLGQNPTEAERISKLGMTAQVREIDKLTSKFTSTTSSAPTPITPTKGTDSAVKDISKMSMDEFAKHRNLEGA